MNAIQLKPLIKLKQINGPINMPDEYLRMQVIELGKRVEELKKGQHQSIRAFNDLKNEITKYKTHNERLIQNQEDDFVTYGKTVWIKSSGKGPFVTINRVALKVDTDKGYSRTVMGWICTDADGNFFELAEEDLSNKLQNTRTRIENASDWPVLVLILATAFAPLVLFAMALAVGFYAN